MRPLRRALPSATATLALAAVLLANAPALAQDVPEAVRKDLWCGIAFTIIAREAPGDASAEQKALATRFEDGGVAGCPAHDRYIPSRRHRSQWFSAFHDQ